MLSLSVDMTEAIQNSFMEQEELSYVWIQKLDSVGVVKVSDLNELDLDTLLELRAFNNNKELHIFWFEDEFRAVMTVKENEDCFYEEKQLLRKKFGDYITMRHYISYQEDGQAYISNTAICDYNK